MNTSQTSTVTEQDLEAYLDDKLDPVRMAEVEQALRESEELNTLLHALILARDAGEHSVGAIWRRNRLSCPSREQLRNFLTKAMSDDHLDYVRFHLEVIECLFCQADLDDLKSLQDGAGKGRAEKTRKLFEAGRSHLPPQPKRKPNRA